MPAFFEMSDPTLSRQFSRFQQPAPHSGREARALASVLLAEAASCRRHGDIGAAIAAEADALRMIRAASRKAVAA